VQNGDYVSLFTHLELPGNSVFVPCCEWLGLLSVKAQQRIDLVFPKIRPKPFAAKLWSSKNLAKVLNLRKVNCNLFSQ
jgi:hypothetical protein